MNIKYKCQWAPSCGSQMISLFKKINTTLPSTSNISASGDLVYIKYISIGAELGLFVGGVKINITKYNICFNVLYMSCKKKTCII